MAFLEGMSSREIQNNYLLLYLVESGSLPPDTTSDDHNLDALLDFLFVFSTLCALLLSLNISSLPTLGTIYLSLHVICDVLLILLLVSTARLTTQCLPTQQLMSLTRLWLGHSDKL